MFGIAVLTLTPRDGPEASVQVLAVPQACQRVLTINPNTKHINVGRTSKNLNKGLVAAKDNAWFDSPIMSRQHAKLSVVPHKVRHTIYPFLIVAGPKLTHEPGGLSAR